MMKRCYSLKRNKEFRRVYRTGKSVGSHTLVLIFSASRRGDKKIGLAVGKKVGNAVMRNRVKRRLREAVTPLLPDIKPGYRLIFIARQAIAQASYQEIESAVRRLLDKAGVLSGGA